MSYVERLYLCSGSNKFNLKNILDLLNLLRTYTSIPLEQSPSCSEALAMIVYHVTHSSMLRTISAHKSIPIAIHQKKSYLLLYAAGTYLNNDRTRKDRAKEFLDA